MNSKTVVIIANGPFPTHEIPLQILKNADHIFCCDGAADSLLKNTDLKPDIIIGDLDSVSENTKIKFSDRLIQIDDQNSNDLTKAFEYAVSKKFGKIIFIGTTGGREDHTISNLFLLIHFAKQTDIEIYTDHGTFISVRGQKKIKSFCGQQISFFAENTNVIIDCKNLKWPLLNKTFEHPWQGSLNQSLTDELEIQIANGVCLVFLVYEK